MKIAFLFSGQGSQYIGMGKELYMQNEKVQKLLEKAENLTGLDIKNISLQGPEELLNQTLYTQLSILINSLSIAKVLEENNIKASEVAGLSLGEYSALIYAGVIPLDDGIKLVKKRGEMMEKYLPKGEYKMASFLGLSKEDAIKAVEMTNEGFVQAVNFICPGQVVVSGDEKGIQLASENAKNLGGRVMPLNTSGPFHTKLFNESKDEFIKELRKIDYSLKDIRVLKNIDGTYYDINDDFASILANHIVSPVYLEKEIEAMLKSGINIFIEVGPSKSLSGAVKRTAASQNKEVKVYMTNTAENLEKTITELKGMMKSE